MVEEFEAGDFTFVFRVVHRGRGYDKDEPKAAGYRTLTFPALADTWSFSYTVNTSPPPNRGENTYPASLERDYQLTYRGWRLEVDSSAALPSYKWGHSPRVPPPPPRPPFGPSTFPPVPGQPTWRTMGEVTLWASATEALTMAPQVGDTITGAVMDPDGGVTGESWQWARTTTPAMMDSWMDIAGETNAAYTVTEGDTGYYLRVMATYTDAVGTDTAMEYSMPTMMVGAEAGDPLFGYDTSGNGRIDKDELAKAVLDYEINLDT